MKNNINNMTFNQLLNACNNHLYLMLSFRSGKQMAVNSKMSKLSIKKYNPDMNMISNYIGYYPCSFNEYISNKRGFF